MAWSTVWLRIVLSFFLFFFLDPSTVLVDFNHLNYF
jgi:hypothetical protein